MQSPYSIGYLILENGMSFRGLGFFPQLEVFGEVVFNTSMTGYQEILTDPSYTDQIIIFTNPHIGNTGINDDDHESSHIWAKGVICRQVSLQSSHWQTCQSLTAFLFEKKIPFLFQIDTRTIVRVLATNGSHWAAMISAPFDHAEILAKIEQAKRKASTNLFSKVSTTDPYTYCDHSSKGFHVLVYDFGVKKSILNALKESGCRVTVVPWNTAFQAALELQPQGIVLSNGPGDPCHCQEIFETIRQFVKRKIPIMGICLGHQILALSLGAKIIKMKNGHHGSNHPVHHEKSDQISISAQNHHYCVADIDLPECLTVTSRSLFDQTIQGISHRESPAFGFQGHPEASPGPHDIRELFGEFFMTMQTMAGKCPENSM